MRPRHTFAKAGWGHLMQEGARDLHHVGLWGGDLSCDPSPLSWWGCRSDPRLGIGHQTHPCHWHNYPIQPCTLSQAPIACYDHGGGRAVWLVQLGQKVAPTPIAYQIVIRENSDVPQVLDFLFCSKIVSIFLRYKIYPILCSNWIWFHAK